MTGFVVGCEERGRPKSEITPRPLGEGVSHRKDNVGRGTGSAGKGEMVRKECSFVSH